MILSALNKLYDRLEAEDAVPAFGYRVEKISFALIIGHDGHAIEFEDRRLTDGKKPRARPMRVPADPEASRVGTKFYAHPLWDKTSYALGITGGETHRLDKEHETFVDRQKALFGDLDDPALQRFCLFLDWWEPSFAESLPGYTPELLDKNIVFRIDGEHEYLHQRPVVDQRWRSALKREGEVLAQCLVTGESAPIASGHPRIRDVDGAQSSGAALISFNSNAYLSYGQGKETTAALSKPAAFGYATALNHLLRRDNDNRHRLKLGDSTVVFWAEAPDRAQAEAAEDFFAAANDPPDDEQENKRIRDVLEGIAAGRPIAALAPDLHPDTRFFVLGLAPNAARISVRFWCTADLEPMLRRFADHRQDLMLDPVPWKGVAPAMWRLLYATAPSRDGRAKSDDVSPVLAGELMRAILTGSRYPRSLLANTVMRFRNDGEISGIRVALCKAVLNREARLSGQSSHPAEIPMSLDRSSSNPGYLLGRLFAELENAQRTALGRVNASIKDRYFGSASATPASVFPVLVRNAQHHLSNIRKGDKGGLAGHIEGEIGAIVNGLSERFPKSLRIEDQGRFALGYYHQREARFAKKPDEDTNDQPRHEGLQQ